ncbi:MAG TPA: LysR substrate-binding domain-containing protein [Labilithrix sp.]|nr:LysR substrate-binding domain-containing protein [Labilithrix sp.]
MRASPDDILGMAFFARVVEARSFSDAARSLGLSKSAVSARVSRLEERLGVRLLHRTTRKLALTADGVRLYERCARVVAEADEAAEVAAGASASPRGILRVHACPAFAQSYLVGPIGEFMQAFPEVRLELRLGDRVPDVGADALDVSIIIARRLRDSSLRAKKLAAVRVVTCASPAYLRRKGIPFRPQDLVHHHCLTHVVADVEAWSFITEEGEVSITAGARIVVDDIRFLRTAALDGLGIAMFPELVVARDLAARRLVRVLDDFQTIELTVFALHPHAHQPPASVRAFLDHLRTAFHTPPWESPAPVSAPTTRTATSTKVSHSFPMTEQDVRRLHAVSDLYEDVNAESAARLRRALSRVTVTLASKIPRTTVTMNSRVICRDSSEQEHELTLVYPWDARGNRISVLSPRGRALLGASIGATLDVGERALTVVSIPYQPEAAGDHHL